jgi:hypothetical protein
MLDAGENVLRLSQKDAAGVGQRCMLMAAIEQSGADRFFELANLLAQRWLFRAQARRGAREAELFGDSNEAAKVPECHVSRNRSKIVAPAVVTAGANDYSDVTAPARAG